MKSRLWVACLLGGVLLSACAPAAAVRVGRQIGATLYLPQSLPPGMRLTTVQRIGAHMAWLSYHGDGGALSIFESPEPIAPPPGASRDKHGVWQVVALVGGQRTRSMLIRLPGQFVEAMAVGVGQASFAKLAQHWRRVSP